MKFLKSAFLVGFFTIISRITGFARDVIIARIIGTGMFADVFFAAFKLTNLLRKVLIEGSFFAAFVPAFSKIKEKYGLEEARGFSSKMFSIAFYVVILIVLFANIFMPQITKFMAPGFKGAKLEMTVSLSYIIFWYFVAISLISILSGTLNAIRKFSYYSIVPIFLNFVIILFVLYLQPYFQNIAYCLAWSVVVGGVVQFFFIYFACVYEKFTIKLQLPKHSLFDENTKTAYKKMLPSIIGGGLTQLNTMVDLILGSFIASGVSYLYYADRIFFLPTSVIGTAISIVILPFISKHIATKNFEKANNYIREAIELSAILVLPACFFLFCNAQMIISVIFERGKFFHQDVLVVSKMLKFLAISLPFCVFAKVLSSIFFSYSNTKIPMFITFFSVIVNISFSILMMPHLGVFAITIGTMISYILSFVVSFFILLRKKMLVIQTKTFFFIIKIAFTSFGSILLIQLLAASKIYGYDALILQLGLFAKLCYILALITVSGSVYLALNYLLGVNIFKMLFSSKR